AAMTLRQRSRFAKALCCFCSWTMLWGQQVSLAPVKASAPFIVRPYLPAEVPPVRLANSARLRDLVRGGTLYLTAQDAIALALENNIDLELARYNPLIAASQLERLQAGGALPGVPSGAAQAGSVAVGQGVAGAEQAAGVNIGTASNRSGRPVNATISQIGPVTQTLDPIFQDTSTYSHTSTPQPNTLLTGTTRLVDITHV